MKACLNNPEHKYKGDEKSPLGLGHSPKNLNDGTLMVGQDKNLWFVKNIQKKGNVWTKIDFNNLAKDCYVPVFFPVVDSLEENREETGIEEKFGGNKPFFIEGETWPKDKDGISMTFICQFINQLSRTKKELIRIFMNVDNEEDIFDLNVHVSKINLNKQNLKKQITIENKEVKTTYPTHFIKKWTKSKELKSFKYICNKYTLDEKSEMLDDFYHQSNYVPCFHTKVGGTPTFCQYYDNIENKKHLFQFTECDVIPYAFGDCGVAHIFADFEFYWDCY